MCHNISCNKSLQWNIVSFKALADNSDWPYVSNVARSGCFTFCIMVSLQLLWHKLSSHRFCLMRSEGPTSIATGRWMKTSPSASPSIKVSVAFTTAFTLMSPSSISPGTARSDLLSLSFITKHVSLWKLKYQHSFEQTLCDRGTALLSSLFCVHNRVAPTGVFYVEGLLLVRTLTCLNFMIIYMHKNLDKMLWERKKVQTPTHCLSLKKKKTKTFICNILVLSLCWASCMIKSCSMETVLKYTVTHLT